MPRASRMQMELVLVRAPTRHLARSTVHLHDIADGPTQPNRPIIRLLVYVEQLTVRYSIERGRVECHAIIHAP